MYVGEGTEELVHVQLNGEHWHWCLELYEMARSTVYRLGHIFENEV